MMGIGEWFTIFGILLAVYALYTSEERTILSHKIRSWQKAVFIAGLVISLLLVKYEDVANKFQILKSLEVDSGLHSSNWALLTVLILAGLLIYLLMALPKKIPKPPLIGYYRQLMNRDFHLFYKLFNRYEKNSTNKAHFDIYKEIIFQPVFLDGVSHEPYYFLKLIESIDQNTFSIYFKSLLNNPNSIFYKELKSNDGDNLVEPNNYLLRKLLRDNPTLFIEIGGLKIIKEWYIKHLGTEKPKKQQSIYNHAPDQLIDFQLELPVYLHILFIKLLYNEAINNRVDIGELPGSYTNMQSIYSNMIEKFVDNIDKSLYAEQSSKEYPTRYHYLISEIFSAIAGWVDSFNDEDKFIKESSLLGFFCFSMRFCISELIEGYHKDVVSVQFVNRMLHYHVFSIYYKHDLKEPLRKELEDTCITSLPKDLLPTILTYSLDEEYALRFDNFKARKFTHSGSNTHENVIIERLYKTLNGKDLI